VYITIQIKYMSEAGRVFQAGSFSVKGRRPEVIGLEWLQQIKRSVTFVELISVIVGGKEDITDKIKALDKIPIDKPGPFSESFFEGNPY
jgi:hypothetical protein